MLAALLLHISLAFPPATPLSPAVRASAVAEAAAIWAPRGILVDGGEPFSPLVLTVVTAPPATARGTHAPLAAIVFLPDGTPEPRIVVYLAAILRLIGSARFLGLEEAQWPPRLRETILGRAIGRVLAHEIGHYATRSRTHTADGLMRSFQRADDLVGSARAPFAAASIDTGLDTGNGVRVGERGERSSRRRDAARGRQERPGPAQAGAGSERQ